MKEILLNVCMTAIALCIFKMLIPENSMKKQTNFLISCFFLASLAFFFTSGKANFGVTADSFEFSLEDSAYSDFSESYAESQKRAFERELRANLERVLKENQINVKEIHVSVNISDKFSISINEIRLVLVTQEQGLCEEELNEEDLKALKEAIHIVKKEVGLDILVTGEFNKHE